MVAISVERMQRARVSELRPTQMTVGMREVRRKIEEWQEGGKKLGEKFVERHMIPAVLGPNQHLYIVDHHHLARALHEVDVKEVLVVVLAKLDRLDKSHFWTFLDNHAWVHPYDAQGKRRDYGKIPKSVAELEDDPYRSLAGELRRVGGLCKGRDALHRVSLGRRHARPHRPQAHREGLRACARAGAEIREKRRCRLSARLVRAEPGFVTRRASGCRSGSAR
jgi:hypothetical protein